MMGMLSIKELCVPMYIGVYAWEERVLQDVYINVDVTYDFKAIQDDIAHAVDYDALSKYLTENLKEKRFKLIETVCLHILDTIQVKYTTEHIRVSVSKPGAIPNAKNVSVVLEMSQRDYLIPTF